MSHLDEPQHILTHGLDSVLYILEYPQLVLHVWLLQLFSTLICLQFSRLYSCGCQLISDEYEWMKEWMNETEKPRDFCSSWGLFVRRQLWFIMTRRRCYSRSMRLPFYHRLRNPKCLVTWDWTAAPLHYILNHLESYLLAPTWFLWLCSAVDARANKLKLKVLTSRIM